MILKYILPGLIISVCGVILVALSWLTYFGLYLGLESLFYPNNPQAFPADTLRSSTALILMIIYLLIARIRMPHILKATLFVAPLSVFIIAIILAFYKSYLMIIVIPLELIAIVLFVLFNTHKTWHYYFATFVAVVLAFVYGWPR